VEQIARSSLFIAHDGRSGFQIANAAEMEPAQDAADGGTTSSDGERDAESGPALAAQPLDQVDLLGRAAQRRAQRTGGPIMQAGTSLLLITADPLGCGFGSDFELGCQPSSKSLPEKELYSPTPLAKWE
jgi:hypothetical protein